MGDKLPPNAPLTEEQILAANIGKPPILDSTIELKPYDPDWPLHFETLAARIRRALGAAVIMLEHAGSTAVPGLSAKPVIDIVLVVSDSADERTYVPALEALGYVLKIREADWFEHRLLKTPDLGINLHVFSHGCEEVGRLLMFRDWLRTHADDRALYERTKVELAARTWKYMQNYADAKSEIVNEIMSRARGRT